MTEESDLKLSQERLAKSPFPLLIRSVLSKYLRQFFREVF